MSGEAIQLMRKFRMLCLNTEDPIYTVSLRPTLPNVHARIHAFALIRKFILVYLNSGFRGEMVSRIQGVHTTGFTVHSRFYCTDTALLIEIYLIQGTLGSVGIHGLATLTQNIS